MEVDLYLDYMNNNGDSLGLVPKCPLRYGE